MENIKCKIIANRSQLENVGISNNISNLTGYIQKEYGTGFYVIKIPNFRINSWLSSDIIVDIPKTFVTVYPPELTDIKIFVDMDGVLCDFHGAYKTALINNPDIKYPQSQYGFFSSLDMIPNKYNYLSKFFDVRILTSPSAMNPMCYTEKRSWVEQHLGLDAALNMIISPDKSIVGGENDYLIDDLDNHERSRQQDFNGTLIHYGSEEFPDWIAVSKYFIEQYNLKIHEKAS
jgi:hypothetical protein